MPQLGPGVDLVGLAHLKRECFRHGLGFLDDILLLAETAACALAFAALSGEGTG